MPIIAKTSGGNFTPAPSGAHPAVCVDVVDLGTIKVQYGQQPERETHKIRIVWQIADTDPQGKPFQVARMYTLSLHEKSALRKDLESWRGQKFTELELKGWDVEQIIGIPCLLNVLQETNGRGDTYANLKSIMRLPKGMPGPTPRDYIRVKDRPDADKHIAQPPDEFSDDEVPF